MVLANLEMAELTAVLIDLSCVAALLAAWGRVQRGALKYWKITIIVIMISCIKCKHVCVPRDTYEELVFAIPLPMSIKL